MKYAINSVGAPVSLADKSLENRGGFRCPACGARLLLRVGSAKKAGSFIHASKPNCQKEKEVEAFMLAASAVYFRQAGEAEFISGLRLRTQEGTLALHKDLGLIVLKKRV